MISVNDVWAELVAAELSTKVRVFGEPERQYRLGYRSGVLATYCILTGEGAEEVHEKLTAQLQREYETTTVHDQGIR